MKSLETLQSRLKFNGGNAQQARMNESKLKSLKRALLYSYQAATAILSDGREFRCLINPDKLKYNYDDKIISIPFKDICLNADKIKRKTMQDIENINMQPGDVFTWKENGSHWIIYARRLEEYNRENTNEKIRSDYLVGFSYCVEPGVAYYFPCKNRKFKNITSSFI